MILPKYYIERSENTKIKVKPMNLQKERIATLPASIKEKCIQQFDETYKSSYLNYYKSLSKLLVSMMI